MTPDKLHQWHDTQRISEGGIVYFLKKYEPNSYEIRNELTWLFSNMIRTCHEFGVPDVKHASVKDGYIKMNFIEQTTETKPHDQIIDYLVAAAAELHGILKAENPSLRTTVTRDEYKPFLKEYTQKRITSLEPTEFKLPPEIVEWILHQINELRVLFFTIVHRDMRARHLLFGKKSDKPILVDWEFTNISDPAQDLAKIIYDATVNGLDRKEVTERVLQTYASLRKISKDELAERVNVFLPIIPLERAMSLINRKPTGYEPEILRDLWFIEAVYEENK